MKVPKLFQCPHCDGDGSWSVSYYSEELAETDGDYCEQCSASGLRLPFRWVDWKVVQTDLGYWREDAVDWIHGLGEYARDLLVVLKEKMP